MSALGESKESTETAEGVYGEAGAASGSHIDLSVPFGQSLVSEGLVDAEEVERTVVLQGQLAKRGVFLRLGELLVARGFLDEATVTKVLALQGTQILVCRKCLSQFNVLAYQENKRYRCSRCSEVLQRQADVQELAVEDTLIHEDWRELFDLKVTDGKGREFGGYTILGQISRGGMGIIYKARQRSLDRIVAMKVVASAEGGEQVQTTEQFTREAKAVAALRHPHIIAIHEVGRLGEVDYYTMDYIEGLPLNRAVAAEGLNDREVVEIMTKICDAVEYIHARNLVHGDMKPENILVDRDRNAVLIDFGIARSETEDPGDTIVGSPGYLPPEYIAGDAPYNKVGEIYALGATLYASLVGRPPHGGVDTVQILRAAHREKPKHIRSIRRSVDRDLATIVMTAVAPTRERYSSVADFLADLRRWLEGDEIAGKASRWGRLWQRWRGRVAATIGLGVALILPIVTGAFTLRQQELEKSLREERAQSSLKEGALRQEVFQLRVRMVKLMIEEERFAKAETFLTKLLPLEAPKEEKAEFHLLRAEARRRLKRPAAAALDEAAAKKLKRK